jgi:hypothetical protein
MYICVDNNKHEIPEYDGKIPIIKIDNKICESAGFKNSVAYFKNRACSRDKALYYFSKKNMNYDNVWFIEEDVLVPHRLTIEKIDEKYEACNADLLCTSNIVTIYKQTENDWFWWPLVNREIKLDPPYGRSMICAIRVSKKLIKAISAYADKYNSLFMDEVLFNTIAIHENLEIKTISELSTIYYKNNWKMEDIKKTNLYHPIKNHNTQRDFRKFKIKKKLVIDKIPTTDKQINPIVNSLPKEIDSNIRKLK